MNAATEARQSELDRVTDSTSPSAELAGELFAVADLLGGQPSLRNALSDPTSDDGRRRGMAGAVFAGRISAGAAKVVGEAAALRWGTGSRMAAALERQGLRTLFATAQASGTLGTVEDELFRFSRTVVSDQPLREALDDRNAPLEARRQLVSDLLEGRADPITVQLAQRAVASPSRSFELTVEGYLRLAAASQQRQVAVVTVAHPLDHEQRERLQTVLSEKLGRTIALQVLVDPAVLGGVQVRVGDEVIEGTVAGRLAAARQQLTTS
jgi:F-type H+-transporting ATPase subunit delta